MSTVATTPELSHVLRIPAVCNYLSISPSTFWRLVKSGELQTIRVSPHGIGVLRTTLEAYTAKQSS